MKLNSLLLAVAALAVCLAINFVKSEEPNGATALQETPPTSARAKFQLPKLFDFERFKALFKKNYKSLTEELARQKVFLGRAFRAFLSAVAYMHGKASSYLGVNQMSDWTPEDIARSKINADVMRSELPKNVVRPTLYSEEDSSDVHLAYDSLPAAELGDIEKALEEIELHKNEPGYREMAMELEAAVGASRKKRNAAASQPSLGRQMSLNDLMHGPTGGESPEVQEKIRHRVKSNNPEREQIELMSFGVDQPEEVPMGDKLTQMINRIPGGPFVSSLLDSASKMFTTLGTYQDGDVFYDASPMDIDQPDVLFVDHRGSNCFFTPRNQGNCGSCYAFAAMALFEYLYCLSNNELVAFSEQYMIDCGHQVGLGGCNGAMLRDSLEFVNKFGVELRSDYPYRTAQDQCPYEPRTRPEQMGYIKLKNPGLGFLQLDQFDRYLSRRPILFGLTLSPEFRNYGGGVDESPDCQPDDAHAMLIVGHGREDEKEYYLLRNSHSVSWGEAGYYKITKEALRRCGADPIGFVAKGHFGQESNEKKNPKYTGHSNIKHRYKEYLLNTAATEIHQIRGLSGAGPIELPCLVDQANCGEVYYITWTKQQSLLTNSSSSQTQSTPSIALAVQLQQQQPWTRVYLYTGANDSAPHKPIGDLLSRANFLMPTTADLDSPTSLGRSPATPPSSDEDRPTQQPPLAKLVIEDPRLSDEALYKCDVTYVKGKCPSISLVRVQMMALPSKAQIVGQLAAGASPSGPIAEGQLIGPFNEHDQLKLVCLVYGGRPQPKSVIWRKIDASGRTINLQSTINARQQQASGHYIAAAAATGATTTGHLVELNLNHTLTSADLGAKFECHVEHEAIEEPPARVVVTGIDGASARLPAGPTTSDALLDLHPARSMGPEQQQAREQVSRSKSLDSHVYVDLNVGVASLDLFMAKVNRRNSSEPLKEGDLVELECVAYNSKPPANITWFNGPDSIEQLDPTTAAAVVGGGDTAPGNSAATTNNWHQQHKLRHKRLLQRNQVHQNSDGQTYNTHSFLSIKLSRHEHKAQILCKAQNGAMRQPMAKSLELQVEHAPIVLMEPAAGITVNESPPSGPDSSLMQQQQQQPQSDGAHVIPSVARQLLGSQAVGIYCIYSANPTELLPNSTRWFKDGQPLQLSGSGSSSGQLELESEDNAASSEHHHHLTESLTPTGYPALTIHQVSRRDAGSYECQLANSVGTSERLPASEACRLEVNFRPTVQLRLYRPIAAAQQSRLGSADQYSMGQLTEMDLTQELVLAGSSLVLSCEVLEAQPNKINKFHWFKKPLRPTQSAIMTQQRAFMLNRPPSDTGDSSQLMGATESGQFVLQSLAANFTPHSFACTASNSLGSSDQSNPIEIQLSYTPGPSFVRPVNDPTLRKTILSSGRPARTSSVIDSLNVSDPQPLPAGRELLLECVTPDLGQPRANILLWFKNGNPIELSPPGPLSNRFQQQHPNSNNPSNPTIETEANAAAGDSISNRDDNPINGQELSALANGGPSTGAANNKRRVTGGESEGPHLEEKTREIQRSTTMDHSTNVRLVSSGRYLFIPSIQLVHKGNYSCVAVNRFGSSQKLQQQQTTERDSYQVNVALAPSFVQPLASRTYWSETSAIADNDEQMMTTASSSRQLELVCHVQCEPICQVEWFRNNEPLDLKRQTEGLSSNYVTYQVKQSIFDENLETNLFKSIESKLIIQFLDNPIPSNGRSSQGRSQQQYSREKVMERRALLSGSNYTCQSGPNTMGPPVRSTTKFIVQFPPENVLINAPSDKLSLVEGSNGPSLSCEASGEPQVQYRWFLLKSSSSSDLSIANLANRFGHKTQGSISQSSKASASGIGEQQQQGGGGPMERPIDQVANKAFGGSSARGVNDATGLEQNLIELTGSASEHGGGAFSTLDLSNLSLDRKQTGRYICEASNRLGQTRQSVYVNVLYKPTCATMHLHSLDLAMLPSMENSSKGGKKQEMNQNRYKPYRATTNEEYALARETSEDFIDLRKVLVLSPLLNRQPSTVRNDDELSFKGSIFQTILHDKRIQDSSSVSRDAKGGQIKDTDALIHTDDKSDFQHNLLMGVDDNYRQSSNQMADSSRLSNSTGDSWEKFNILLLKFLNSYMKQVKLFEERTIDTARRVDRDPRVVRQNRRSSQANPEGSDESGTREELTNDEQDPELGGSTRNLLTFACMAQDANPMSDLMFDWSFGSTSLPETSETSLNIDPSSTAYLEQDSNKVSLKPVLVYTNDNYTLQVMLVRRLDTRSSLNPFQMSLVTLNVIVEPSIALGYTITNRIARQAMGTVNNRSPVVRHRYQQSLYNSLRGGQSSVITNNNNNNNNIQFAQEFETRAYNLGASSVELNERNWEEQIGNLLKCRVTNQIGTSDVCHVRVNIAERLKSQSSSSEFAKWRMPSLANKSLLIISIMIGCALIIFVTMALLLGPHLKELHIKKDETMRRRADNNTGQSTCSQKSSVLGLLGNGDSSIQGSSDDDSSAKMNHIDNKGRLQNRMHDMDDLSISKAVTNGYCRHHQLSQESGISYDEPRSLQDSRSVYTRQLDGTNRNDMINELDGNYRYDGDLVDGSGGAVDPANQSTTDSKTIHGSAGSRLLANLKFKSLSKFKVDRISDLSSFANRMDQMRNLHSKNTSNSETNTTGLSVSALDSEQPMKMTSPTFIESPTFFDTPSLRHSHLGVRRQAVNNQQQQPQIYSLDSAHIFNQNGLQSEQDTQAMQLSSRRLMNATSNSILPAYSNMVDNDSGPTALDEFIRQREVDPSVNQGQVAAFYRSHSNRTTHQSLYLLKDDMRQFYHQPMNRGPPVYPRTHQSTTMYRSHIDDNRPSVVARSSQRHMAANVASQPYPQINNRFSMAPYHQTLSVNEVPVPNMGFMDTIDSHLNRLTDNVVNGHYLNQNTPYANAINSNPYTQDLYNDVNQNQSVEHIYDVNAYATPEQTPQRRPNSISQAQSSSDERPRVSQLIQTFNSKAPE